MTIMSTSMDLIGEIVVRIKDQTPMVIQMMDMGIESIITKKTMMSMELIKGTTAQMSHWRMKITIKVLTPHTRSTLSSTIYLSTLG